MQGFITIHRKMVNTPIYKDSHAVHLWIHLLMKCNYKDGEVFMNGRVYAVNRGQTLTGRKALSSETGIQESKIERLLKVFEKLQMIEQQTNSRNRLITVLSYDSYQNNEQHANNRRTTGEQPANTNNNINKDNKVNNKPLSKNKFSDDDMKTATWIYERLLKQNPNHKKPNFDSWANTIRLMIENDKRTHSEICKVFAWANNDHFWSTNILSPAKLREKFDMLSIKANQPAAVVKPLFKGESLLGIIDNKSKQADYIEHDSMGVLTYEHK